MKRKSVQDKREVFNGEARGGRADTWWIGDENWMWTLKVRSRSTVSIYAQKPT
jgi:hypothetical protein